MASFWIGSGAGWSLKGLGVASPDHQVGANFEALDEGVLMAVLKSFEHFFAILNPAAALCIFFVYYCQLELNKMAWRLFFLP